MTAPAPLTARAVRRTVIVLCVAGVAGLILTSILDADGAAITIGLLTAAAVLCLIVATAVAPRPGTTAGEAVFDEDQAEVVEAHVADLVRRGADEAALRSLVREAVRLGRGAAPAGDRSGRVGMNPDAGAQDRTKPAD